MGTHRLTARGNRALARALDLSEGAVRKARREGRLSGPGPKGWDVEAARRELDAASVGEAGRAGRRRRSADVAQAERRVRDVLRQHGRKIPAVLTLTDARRAKEVLRCDVLALDLAERRGELIEVAVAVKAVEAYESVKKAILLDMPAAEADTLAEAMTRDCTVGTAKLQLERIVHSLLTRLSETAFAMAAAQPSGS